MGNTLVAAVPRLIEKSFDRRRQAGLIILDHQHIVGLLFDNHLGNGLLATQGVDGDNTAFEQAGIEQLRNGRDFVRFFRGLHLPQRDPEFVGESGHPVDGFLAPRFIPPHRLAVQGDPQTIESAAKRAHPVDEAAFEHCRIQQGESPSEGIVGRDAIGKRQELPQPIQLGSSPQGHTGPAHRHPITHRRSPSAIVS